MLKSKIARRNIAAVLLIVVTSLSLVSLYLIHYFRTSTLESAKENLILNARIIETALKSDLCTDNHDLAELAAAISSDTKLRITILSESGAVLADTSETPESLDNHLARSEVQAAINSESGYGTAIRFSQTLHENLMYVAIPVYKDGIFTGVIRTSASLGAVDKSYNEIIRVILAAIFLAFIAAMAIAIRLTKKQTEPIEKMSRAALAIASGDLERRIPLNSGDEFDILAHTINKLTGSLAAKIRESQAKTHKLELILEHMDNAVMLIDLRGNIIETNREARRIFALSPSDLQHHSIHLIGSAELSETAQAVLKNHTSTTITMKAKERTFKVYLSSFCDVTASDVVIAVFYDISLIQELVDRQREFTGNAAHELATPLTAIAGFAELLSMDDFKDTASARHYAEIICREAQRMNRLIKDLLMLSRLDDAAYRAEIPQVPVDCISVLTNAAASLKSKAAAKKQIIATKIPTDKAAIKICAAPDLIEQILRNLTENAIKYTPTSGTITLSCKATANKVIFSVEDSGIGIPPEHLPRIFDRFYRVDKARARKSGGNGIGLSLVKFLVELFDGEITVKSVVNQGTTFTLTFPTLK